MKEAVIAGYVRSPFHFANKGDLTKVRPDDLTAAVVKALIAKTGIDAKEIEGLRGKSKGKRPKKKPKRH